MMSPAELNEIEAAIRELVELRAATAQGFVLVAVNRALRHLANACRETDPQS